MCACLHTSTCAQFGAARRRFAVDRRPACLPHSRAASDGSLLTEVMWVEKRRRWLLALGLLGSLTPMPGAPFGPSTRFTIRFIFAGSVIC